MSEPSTAKEMLSSNIFKKRGVNTKNDPTKAISAIKCPACKKVRQWRIIGTRTLVTNKDIKRHTICLGCGYAAVFMERKIDGVQTIVLAPQANELELLNQIDKLNDKLDFMKPRARVLDEIWELFEPGRRDTPLDNVVDLVRSRTGAGMAEPGEDVWAEVRRQLSGGLDPDAPCTPSNLAVAIDAVISSSEVALKHSRETAKENFNDKTKLIQILKSIGAKKVGEEGWAFPLYRGGDAEVEYVAPHEWVREMKEGSGVKVTIESLTDESQSADIGTLEALQNAQDNPDGGISIPLKNADDLGEPVKDEHGKVVGHQVDAEANKGTAVDLKKTAGKKSTAKKSGKGKKRGGKSKSKKASS